MRCAYADPPYVGQSKRHYGGSEVNHPLLIAHLVNDFPDGWALSCSSPSLRALLPLCPDDVRIGAWVKPFAVFKPGVHPAYSWEPLIFRGGRRRGRDVPTGRDAYSGNPTMGSGLIGAKPAGFCFWVFDLLGLTADDELVDLFPGSGAVSATWRQISSRLSFDGETAACD